MRLILGVTLAVLVGLSSLIVIWRLVPPVSTPMLARWIFGEPVDRRYVPLDKISSDLRLAVVLSEDARFCRHHGVDWGALREVVDEAEDHGPTRGASTLTMQTVKNLFLWPTRSYLRKAIEIPLALVLDAAWPKRRILEVYLNIAEWGNGIFGAEAAAQRSFGKSAAQLDAWEAALLAVALPSPHRRQAARPSRVQVALAQRVFARMHVAPPALLDCAP